MLHIVAVCLQEMISLQAVIPQTSMTPSRMFKTDGVLLTNQRAHFWRRLARKRNSVSLGLFSHSCIYRIIGLSNRPLKL